MKKFSFKSLLPHIIAIGIFLIVAVVFCKPALEGKILNQHDTLGWRGMAQQSFEVKEKTGNYPLWTNSMFSGMPAYQIVFDPRTNAGIGITIFSKVLTLGLPEPASYFFLACICFYFLCIVLRVNPWVGILGALSYAYSTYNPVIIGAGHNTKMMSLALAPMVIAGLMLLFQRKYLFGLLVTALFTSLLIQQSHLQIVYYTLIIAGVMTVAYVVNAIKSKETAHALKAAGLGIVGGLIGLATCAATMMPTYEYAKESMRGGVSQLKDTTNNKTAGGLDKDYALRWSFEKMETFTFMVPGLMGGSNGGNEHTSSVITDLGIPEESAVGMTNGYSYWGGMSSLNETTSGPAYLGAVVCFLFIFGLFYLKGWQKWWLVAASIFGILLAWGSYLKGFNYLMLDFLPYYSKFRAPSMAMVIPQFCFPLMGVLAVNQLISLETDWAFAWKKFKQAAIATGVLLLFLGAFYVSADYVGHGDAQIRDSFLRQVSGGQEVTPQATQQVNDIIKGIRTDRKSLAGGDLMRSFFLAGLAALLLGLFVKKRVSAMVLSIGLIALSSFDLLGIDTRYLNYEKYKEKEEVDGAFTPSPVDLEIMKDPDHANFRVFNQSPDFTNESLTSYHHNSIGGYHPAKLGLYQDIIERQISKGNPQVINMLNTKYVIGTDQNGRQVYQQNPGAYGTCWLVSSIKFVNTPDEEMAALDNTNLRDTAVLNVSFKDQVKTLPTRDSAAFIKLAVRENDKITYTSSSTTPQFAVFSEVYYSAGWDAFIDGQKVDYAKVDYVLRGLYIPAGKHSIEFKFEPKSFATGRTITIFSLILIYVLAVLTALFYFKKKKDAEIMTPKTTVTV